ncbi:hypothetical protein CFOL_v3_32315 [Cephalotus follicularis]|uniref:Protein BRANCHLESS TRICHOME n=1 Tax=Cephalotus follicularis TaxID=3775 RepID=A0A1Q3D8V2_CEPFO|nr:hypothetical protein CFOL_v3_32315 [Cephalotus follicularis]
MEQVMMMMIKSPEIPSNENSISPQLMTTSTCPSWKLYDNPFYYSQHQQQQQVARKQCQRNNHLHRLHQHPLSTRKFAASFWDLAFFRPIMETELDIARAHIMELNAELEYERKARIRLESVIKRVAKEVGEERRGREAMERLCEELAREISNDKAEIDRLKREMEEERRMLRMAEVLREERVQMKLNEAKILFEEKLLELEETKQTKIDTLCSKVEKRYPKHKEQGITNAANCTSASVSGKLSRLVLGDKACINHQNSCVDSRDQSSRRLVLREKSSSHDYIRSVSSMVIQRRVFLEPENPHIKRGIKGFVEFPRAIRVIGSKSRHWGTKLEYQKAQLRILLKRKSPIRSSSNTFVN